MNKLFAIFLIVLFLCANTSIGQLLKVPNLIEHYKSHNSEGASTTFSFVDFIKLHYTKTAKNHSDKHEDLPFKTFEVASSVFLLFTSSMQLQLIKTLISVKQKFFYHNSFKSHSITSIWLPPKLFS